MYRVGVTWSGATTSTFFILMVDWKPPSVRHIPEKRMCSGVKVVWGPGNPSNALGRSIGALGGTFGVDAVWDKAIQWPRLMKKNATQVQMTARETLLFMPLM